MVKKFLLLTILASLLSSMVACNTVHGVGKDTEKAGDSIQNAADRNR